jgi:hypothetical protein
MMTLAILSFSIREREKFFFIPAFAGNCTGLYGRRPREPACLKTTPAV